MIRHLLMSILANTIAIYGAVFFLAERIQIEGGIWGFVLAGIVFGLLNTILKPIIKLFSLPFVIVTMGLFLVIINMLILWIMEWLFASAFSSLGVGLIIIGGWASYLITAIILSIFNTVSHWILR